MEPDESADDAGQPEASEEEASAQPPQEPESSGNGPAAGSTPVPGRPPRREAPVPGPQMPAGPRAQRPAGGLARVILIERSMGVQVGRDNDQVSVYLATLPPGFIRVRPEAGRDAAEPGCPLVTRCFQPRRPAEPPRHEARRARRLFQRHHREPSGRHAGHRPELARRAVGERNVQRNEFTVRVRAVAVHADTFGMTPGRLVWISRLRANPGDRATARLLAEDLGRAARDRLQADLTARVRQLAGNPRIRRWAGRFRRLVGRQIGGHGNRARVQVDIRTGAVDTRALQRSLRAAAERHQPPPRESRPAPLTARYRPRQSRRARDASRQRSGPDRRSWPDRGGR
jgi:hypothetical protein